MVALVTSSRLLAILLVAAVRWYNSSVLTVELGSSWRAWLLLISSSIVMLGFGGVWAASGDRVSAFFCVAGLLGVARMVFLLSRRAKRRSRAVTVATGQTAARTADGALFVSFAHQVVGARVRDGVVLIGPSRTAFVVTEGWTHLGIRLLTFPTRVRFRFVDLAIEMPSIDDLDLALESLVARHGGVMLDDTWTYAAPQRWLVQPGGGGVVRLERPPPPNVVDRFRAAPLPTPERVRWIRNRIGAVLLAIAGALVVAGLAAWRLTGEVDYLVAGSFYAGLIVIAGVVALIVIRRRFA